MRKTGYIIGTICAVFSLAGAALKLTGLPGGGILLILFTSLFSIAAMPLFLYSLAKTETEKVIQFAIRLCGFSFVVLQVGLLFYAQRWPEPMRFIYIGTAGQIVFLIVFLVNAGKPEVKTKRVSMFTVLAIIVLGALGLGCVSAENKKEQAQKMRQDFITEWKKYSALSTTVEQSSIVIELDTTLIHDKAIQFRHDYSALITYIESLKEELVNMSNSGEIPEPDTIKYSVVRPTDFDVPTYYFVGADPSVPNGKGNELYQHLRDFKQNVLHPDIKFEVPIQDGKEFEDQWVKDNFYHTTVMDALKRLTVIQKSILLSVQESYDKKLFREAE